MFQTINQTIFFMTIEMWDSRDATQVVDPAMAIFRFLGWSVKSET